MEVALWPFLAALLHVTFVQVPLDHLPEAWRDQHFMQRFLLSVALAKLALVPLPAVVVFLIAGAQVETAAASLAVLGQVLAAFVLFLAGAPAIGIRGARQFALPAAAARMLGFSAATRNSFVVLHFALALPPAWHAAVVVIISQSLVELLGMLAFLRRVPRRLP